MQICVDLDYFLPGYIYLYYSVLSRGHIADCIFILKNVISEETDITILYSGIDYILGQKLML